MKVLILGSDGYLGWTLAQYLSIRGHEVAGVDNFARRKWVLEMGSISAVPVSKAAVRIKAFKENFGKRLPFYYENMESYEGLVDILKMEQPDAVVHLAECPSAPFSMQGPREAAEVQINNVVGTLNLLWAINNLSRSIHLVKLGTMGEYGTPNMRIPEGFFEVEYQGRRDRLPFPRQAGSFYHLSKVHDSHNILFACENWGLRATDIMQGVVYGTRFADSLPYDDPRMNTRLDFDESFGTIVNRFVCQAIVGEPLTVYGKGHQKRGFIPLRESMECISLIIENPPEAGEYRVVNQLANVYSPDQLASLVAKVGEQFDLEVKIRRYENPRNEAEDHFYDPEHQKLWGLGYRPKYDMMGDLEIMFSDLIEHRERIEQHRDVLVPRIRWSGVKQTVDPIS